MTDDWRGEQLIRGVKPTSSERHAETSRLTAAVKAKTTKQQNATVPGYGAMNDAMRSAIAEQRALKRQSSSEGAKP